MATAKKVVNEKSNAGRPTLYKPEFNDVVYKLCLLGATDAQLADFLDVNVDTIHEWKKVHPEFSDSIKKGKYYADSVIANSLYDRAKGMRISRQAAIKLTTKTPVLGKDGEPTRQMKQTEKIQIVDLEEDIPPDTTAGIFWLKNRQPKEWKDKHEVENKNVNVNVEPTQEEAKKIKDSFDKDF